MGDLDFAAFGFLPGRIDRSNRHQLRRMGRGQYFVGGGGFPFPLTPADMATYLISRKLVDDMKVRIARAINML
jgi:hypothetical protein